MNYKKHYENLITKARDRKISTYVEYHHILPKCLGGSDGVENLVALTPEEHYVAHQLLVKINPGNHALVKAAVMMTAGRKNNKLYGWVRRALSAAASDSQSGMKNSQYGLIWIHNKYLKISKKVPKDAQLSPGWEVGRIVDFEKKHKRTKQELLKDKKEKAVILAYSLYYDFLESDYISITSFAKSINTSQPRLTMLWNKYVPQYSKIKEHGKSYKNTK